MNKRTFFSRDKVTVTLTVIGITIMVVGSFLGVQLFKKGEPVTSLAESNRYKNMLLPTIAASFNKEYNTCGVDKAADLNHDGCVNALDFSLLTNGSNVQNNGQLSP